MAKKSSNQAKTKISAQSILEELKTPGLIILGMVGGNMVGKLIDKVVKVDDTATGFQVKALVKPLVQITAGVGGALLLKDNNLKLIASGIAASGIASTVKVFLKKDILQGLTNFAGFGDSDDPLKQVFREPVSLSIAPYNPDLPELSAASSVSIAALPIEYENEVSGAELGDYEVVKQIELL